MTFCYIKTNSHLLRDAKKTNKYYSTDPFTIRDPQNPRKDFSVLHKIRRLAVRIENVSVGYSAAIWKDKKWSWPTAKYECKILEPFLNCILKTFQRGERNCRKFKPLNVFWTRAFAVMLIYFQRMVGGAVGYYNWRNLFWTKLESSSGVPLNDLFSCQTGVTFRSGILRVGKTGFWKHLYREIHVN